MEATSYDAANQQLAFGPVTQTFDANGNLLTRTEGGQTTTYTWDARNRLTGITGPGLAATFSYDGLGRRAVKTLNGQDTAFQYDGLDIVQESGGTGAVAYLRGLTIDEALARTDTLSTLFSLADALGSTVALTDPAGTNPTTYTYAPFGDTAVTGTPSASPFHFTGRENDGTGLYYYRARYYDPARSRFISEDPIGFGGTDMNVYAYVDSVGRVPMVGTNLYQYAANDPLNYTDANGASPVLAAVALAVGQLAIEGAIMYAITGDVPSALLATAALQAAQLGTLGMLSGGVMVATGMATGSPAMVGVGVATAVVSANITHQSVKALKIILKKGKDLDPEDLRRMLRAKGSRAEAAECP